MTEQERAAAFIEGFEELGKRYGIQLMPAIVKSVVVNTPDGPRQESTWGFRTEVIKDWQQPQPSAPQGATEHSNGKPVLTEDEAQQALAVGRKKK